MIKKFYCVKDFLVDSFYFRQKANKSYGILCEKGI